MTRNTINVLLNDPDFIEICYSIKARKEGSKSNLAKALCKYLDMLEECYGKVCTYKDLLKEAKKEQIDIPDIDDRNIGRYINRFPMYLAEQGLAESTVELYYNNVVRFYKRKNVQLPYNGLEKCNVKKSNRFIPEKHDVQNGLKHGSIVAQAIILSQVSSGMGTSELLGITREDFWKGYDKVTGVATLNPTRGKTNEHYYTFLNPEATAAVKQMLKERTDDDPSLFGMKNEAAITAMYSRLDVMCGYPQIPGQYGHIRSHNMRKYFNDTMLNVGKAPVDLVDYLSGRRETETRRAYRDRKPAILKEEYMGYMECLYVVTDVIKPDQETIDDLKAENRELQEQVNSLRSGMDEMLKGLDDQKEKYDTLLALFTKMSVNFKGIKQKVVNLVEE